ncbi:MAG: hypothetical protein WCI43_06105, partial [Candidatus Firestonebacteria bacterium]
EAELTVEVRALKLEPFSDEYYFSAFTYTDFNSSNQPGIEKTIIELKKRGMNLLHGGIHSALKITPAGAEIDFTNIEKNFLLMKKYGFKKCIVELTALPNTFVDVLGCKFYDEKFNKAYKDMLLKIKDKMDKGGWPEIQVMYDEPREFDTDNPRPLARTFWDMENILRLHTEAGLPALPTYMSDDGGPRFEDSTKSATYWEQGSNYKYVMTHGWAPSAKLMRETVKKGNTLYLYNCGYGRFQFGLLTYQLGAKGNVQFWYSSSDSLNTMAQFPTSYAVVTTPKGPFIPTLRWLRSEEGVNDFRYIYTLKKAVERVKDKSAPEAVAALNYLETLKAVTFGKTAGDGRESETVGSDTLKTFGGGKLDEMRDKLAEHIIALNKLK